MSLVIQSLHPNDRSAVRQVDSPDDIPSACPQNFNLFSECFAAVAFNSFPVPSESTTNSLAAPTAANSNDPLAAPNGTDILPPSSLFNYTIYADAGLIFIDVIGHKSDFERRVLPLQWAIDSVRVTFDNHRHAFLRFARHRDMGRCYSISVLEKHRFWICFCGLQG